jgi:hypothetical protein
MLSLEELEPRLNCSTIILPAYFVDKVSREVVEHSVEPQKLGNGPVRLSVINGNDPTLIYKLWYNLPFLQPHITIGEGMDWDQSPWTQLTIEIVPRLGWVSYPTLGQSGFELNPDVNTVMDRPSIFVINDVKAITHEVGHALGLGHNLTDLYDFMYPTLLPSMEEFSSDEQSIMLDTLQRFERRFALWPTF